MIVFYNPHVDDFLAIPPHFQILKRRALKKYGFIIEEALKESNQIRIVLDESISAFFPESLFCWFPRFVRRWISEIEFAWWKKINGLSGRCERIDATCGDHSESVLLMFSYKSMTGRLFREREASLVAFPIVIAHLSHYFIATREKSENLERLENIWLAGDSDISSNPYFQYFFSWYRRQFLVLPFAVAQRFQMRKNYLDRLDSCVATGSFHDLDKEVPYEKYADFQQFFGINTYHPVRKAIYDNRSSLSGDIASLVSPYRGNSQGGLLGRWRKRFMVSQKSYFALDIVDAYNSYRFVVVGEEASGFPALGAFEAMACGAVLIADSRAYEGLGLVDGEHYLSHSGDVDGVVAMMREAREDMGRLVELSKKGVHFVDEHFRSHAAYNRLKTVVNNISVEHRGQAGK